MYVANHMASAGPLAIIPSLPVRFYPWVIAEMIDPKRAPAYIYDDYIQPEWHLHGKPGRTAAAIVGRLAAALLKGIGSVSVEKNAGFPLEAYRHSLELLEEGKSLLIFPEDSARELDPVTMMHPFECGFAGLGRLYLELRGKPLPVFILAVHPESRRIMLDQAPSYTRHGQRRQDDREFCTLLEDKLREQYLELVKSWN